MSLILDKHWFGPAVAPFWGHVRRGGGPRMGRRSISVVVGRIRGAPRRFPLIGRVGLVAQRQFVQQAEREAAAKITFVLDLQIFWLISPKPKLAFTEFTFDPCPPNWPLQ